MNFKRLKNLFGKNEDKILPIKTWMQLEIHENVWEGSNKRVWKLKWLVIKVKKANHPDGTFTIRGESAGMVIEKIYPLSFPNFEKVLLLDEYKTRRSKLYYIRDKVGKWAKMRSKIEQSDRNKNLLDESFSHEYATKKVEQEAKVEKTESSEEKTESKE